MMTSCSSKESEVISIFYNSVQCFHMKEILKNVEMTYLMKSNLYSSKQKTLRRIVDTGVVQKRIANVETVLMGLTRLGQS